MNDQERTTGDGGRDGARGPYVERIIPHVILRYQPESYAAEIVDRLAALAERCGRHVDARLKELRLRAEQAGPATVYLDSSPEAAATSGRRQHTRPILRRSDTRLSSWRWVLRATLPARRGYTVVAASSTMVREVPRPASPRTWSAARPRRTVRASYRSTSV
jgi:hypothetical protein